MNDTQADTTANTLSGPCVDCHFYQPSPVGIQFARCQRIPMRFTSLKPSADQVRADESRCGASGKWFYPKAKK